jgi:proteic killer suppression protein
MILSFADHLTEEVFHGVHSHEVRKKLQGILVKAAERKLDLLNTVENMDELKAIPSHKPDSPLRDGQGKYSIPIHGDLRLAFEWNQGNASKVEIKYATP